MDTYNTLKTKEACYPIQYACNEKVSKATKNRKQRETMEDVSLYLGMSRFKTSQEEEGSGVAGGQVKATKYIVSRYVASMFFTWCICKFHGNTMHFWL